MDHTTISVASVSPHRISADSIAHLVLQALNLEGILDSLLSLTFHIYSISRSYSSAANTHLQLLHLVISHLSPSYPSQSWGKFPRKLSKMEGCVQQGHWDRLGQGKQGWAEGEELRFHGNRSLCKSHGELWDGSGWPQIKATRLGPVTVCGCSWARQLLQRGSAMHPGPVVPPAGRMSV